MRRRIPIPAELIARLIAEGKTNAEIGEAIGKAKNTVDNYVHRLLRRHKCKNRTQLVAKIKVTCDSWNVNIVDYEPNYCVRSKNVQDSTNDIYPSVLIKKKMQARFRRWLFGESGGARIAEYTGSDLSFVRAWINERMTHGMTWNNHGQVWVIDHIVPLRLFDLNIESDCKICWHYKNLMPLFREDNLNKEGNVFFAYDLLSAIKGDDLIYNMLYDRVLPEIEVMNKYIKTYCEALCNSQNPMPK